MLAFRSFEAKGGGTLHSVYAPYLWTRDNNSAECLYALQSRLTKSGHRPQGEQPCKNAPSAECDCGFYAFPSLHVTTAATFLHRKYVLGLVSAYGHVIVHLDGTVRAEHMTILALTRWGDADVLLPAPPGSLNEYLTAAARILGVPWYVGKTFTDAIAFLDREVERYASEESIDDIVQGQW